MSKEAWKWLLEEAMSDDELVKLANAAKIKPAGFSRQLVVDKNFRTIVRPMLLVTMSKRIATVKNALLEQTNEDKVLKGYRGKTVEELEIAIQEGADLKDVLASVLSSKVAENQTNGVELFEKLKASGKLDEYVNKKQAAIKVQVEKNQEEENKKQEELTAKKTTKLEKTIDDLKQTNNKLKTEKEAQKKQFDHERTELLQELNNVKKQLIQLAPEKTKADLEKKQKLWEKERNNLTQKIEQQEKLLKERKSEIERLDQLVRELQSQAIALQQEQTARSEAELTTDETSEDSSSKIKVAFIGKKNKTNLDLAKNKRYHIEYIELDQLEQALESNALQEKEQIWALLHETPLPKQRKLNRNINADRLRIFNNLIELKTHVYN